MVIHRTSSPLYKPQTGISVTISNNKINVDIYISLDNIPKDQSHNFIKLYYEK
jgi:hypothetical protein